jgi:hypothetical protein
MQLLFENQHDPAVHLIHRGFGHSDSIRNAYRRHTTLFVLSAVLFGCAYLTNETAPFLLYLISISLFVFTRSVIPTFFSTTTYAAIFYFGTLLWKAV